MTTLGTYNRRTYWEPIATMDLTGRLPEKILIADRFIGGDSDLTALKEGIAGLRSLGLNVLMTEPSPLNRELAWEAGFRKITWGVYNPPGYAFDFGGEGTSEKAVRKWAAGLREQYTKAGFKATDFAMYIMSDEPGFYYPSMYRTVNENPLYLARFHEYLRQQGMTLEELGVESWDEVKVIGRAEADTLPRKRLYYWSQRFFPRASAEQFATANRAMQEAFYPGMASVTNWNFFSGRCFSPGPFGNNPDKEDPNAAIGCHDWFEFCRVGGTEMPWTEDWFGDEWAYQWSYYSEKLMSASTTGRIGGYVIPRTAGAMPDGMMYKMMALVGHGAKELKFFVFGPEYNFPGNCWSQNLRVLGGLARTTRLIGASEHLLHPGRPTRPQVAMLQHLSSEMWDQKDMEHAKGIVDATNNNMNGHCAEYTAELYDLYLALMHRQIPVEFLSEEDVIWGALDHLKVIYVVEPNVPVEAQERLAAWAKAGGVLVTTSGAATADRYDEPTTILDEVRGVIEGPRDRLVLPNLASLTTVGNIEGEHGTFEVFGPKGALQVKGAEVIGKFEDGAPAVTVNECGEGKAVHFALLPGIAYRRSAKDEKGKFASGFSEAACSWIVFPAELAGVERPVEVDRPMVEAPVLVSEKGVAVTLLNWTNEPQQDVSLRVRVDGQVDTVGSVKQGTIPYREREGFVELKMPVDTVDVLLITHK